MTEGTGDRWDDRENMKAASKALNEMNASNSTIEELESAAHRAFAEFTILRVGAVYLLFLCGSSCLFQLSPFRLRLSISTRIGFLLQGVTPAQ